MSSEDSKLNNVTKTCFLVMWLIIWSFISLMMFPFGIPFLILGILFFMNAMKQKETKRAVQPADLREEITDGRTAVVRADRRIIYQVPRKCPECGGSLSNEEVDWVGPLQAKCPFCRTTIEAQPIEF